MRIIALLKGSDFIKRLVYICAVALGVVMSCMLLELSAPKVNAYVVYSDTKLADYEGYKQYFDQYANMNGILTDSYFYYYFTNSPNTYRCAYFPNGTTSLNIVTGSYLRYADVYSPTPTNVYSYGASPMENKNCNQYLAANNSNVDAVIVGGNIEVLYNGNNIYSPPPAYEVIDNVSFYNSGTYDFNFDLSTTENSLYLPALASYVTHRYTAEINFSVTKNGSTQNIIYQFPTYYTYFPYKSSGMPTQLSSDPEAPLWYKILSRETVDEFTRTFSSVGAIYLPPVVFDGAAQLEWVADEADLFTVHNRWTLRQIFDALSSDYPTLITDLSDLFVSYHYSVYDIDVLVNNSPALVIEGNLDYTGAKEEEIPQDDPNITNLTKSVENVYNQIGGVQYMMSTLTGKSTYSFKSYEKNGLPDFQSINNPEYHYEDVELDTDSMSWFSWLVEYLYLRSPIGMFLTLALGVLVCRMVLW